MLKVLRGALLAVLPVAVASFALPVLQLDIKDGIYLDTPPAGSLQNKESIIATENEFTLYALLNAAGDKNDKLAGGIDQTFHLSVAISPVDAKIVDQTAEFGTFSITSDDLISVSELTWGTPPLDDLFKDIASHSIFPTYYKEISFKFNQSNTSAPYNTQDNPGGISIGEGMLYSAFQVDVSDLNPGYVLHFDLYSGTLPSGNRVGNFAPFSHDAESAPASPASVPEPTTMALFGVSLLALGFLPKRKK